MDDDQSLFVPEEIVVDILARLHIKPLFRFKLVSKLWNSIISKQTFGQKYYLQRAVSSPESPAFWPLCGMLNILKDDQGKTNNIIKASSSGLVLCVANPLSCMTDLSVANPLTKQTVLLPPLLLRIEAIDWVVGFATRACKNPNYLTYKVVYIIRENLSKSDNATIMVFCSDKGEWTCKKPVTCPNELFASEGRATCCKGVLFWFSRYSRSIVTYDPYDNPDRFGQIRLPRGSGITLRNSRMNLIQLGHEEVLKCGDIECCGDEERKLRVWRLEDYRNGEWCLEKKCPISPVFSDDLLRFCRSLVAPAWNGDSFCVFVDQVDRVSAMDLMSAQVVFVDRAPLAHTHKLVAITFCPWSSPLYGQC